MLGMNDGIGIGQDFWHGMVVCHDDIYSHALGQFNGFVSSYPIVHRDDEGNPLLFDKVLVDTGIGTIPICKADRQIDGYFRPHLLQGFLHDRSGRHPVCIIVSVDQDLLIIFDGPSDALHCLVHIVKQVGIMQIF